MFSKGRILPRRCELLSEFDHLSGPKTHEELLSVKHFWKSQILAPSQRRKSFIQSRNWRRVAIIFWPNRIEFVQAVVVKFILLFFNRKTFGYFSCLLNFHLSAFLVWKSEGHQSASPCSLSVLGFHCVQWQLVPNIIRHFSGRREHIIGFRLFFLVAVTSENLQNLRLYCGKIQSIVV